MKKPTIQKQVPFTFSGTIWLLCLCVVLTGLSGYQQEAVAAANQAGQRVATVGPFMHRPYYGDAPVSQRTVSFVDHDKPWYDSDGVFVRYDGTKWSNVSVMGCQPGTNCYDGHNGYDLNLRFEPVLS